MANVRLIALQILERIDTTTQRLEFLIDNKLTSYSYIETNDLAFVSNLVYAVLRHRIRLDYLLDKFLKNNFQKISGQVRAILRLGAAEIALLGHPAFVAVNEAVKLIKYYQLTSAEGLVNAVLRSFAHDWQKILLPKRKYKLIDYFSVIYSHPRWLIKEMILSSSYNYEEIESWLAANQARSVLSIRINTLKVTRDEVARLLFPYAKWVKNSKLVPDSLVISYAYKRVIHLPGFIDGFWQVQDSGATAIGWLLGVDPGMVVLDLCAGVGGKTGHLATLMGNRGKIVAVEPILKRACELKGNMTRLGVKIVEILQVDATELSCNLGPFDRILVDVPCTGLGTIGRRPDIRWQRTVNDSFKLAKLQLALVLTAAKLLASGGVLVYCTCTITATENDNIIRELLANRPDLSLEWGRSISKVLYMRIKKDGYFHLTPQLDHCDAFFAARFLKK